MGFMGGSNRARKTAHQHPEPDGLGKQQGIAWVTFSGGWKMKAEFEKRICGSRTLKESCNRGRKEREEDEMVFSEGERDDDRLKRGSKDKKVNRSRKQKEKKQTSRNLGLVQTTIWSHWPGCKGSTAGKQPQGQLARDISACLWHQPGL